MKIEFNFLGDPKSKGRPKFCRRGKFAMAYTPKETRVAEGDIRSQAISQLPTGFVPLEGALSISATVRRRKPKSAPKRVIHPVTRPDLDNYLKLLLDALNSIVFIDDSQIVSIKIVKIFHHIPGISLSIEEMEIEL